jgi:CheY-like chemotaxis protein
MGPFSGRVAGPPEDRAQAFASGLDVHLTKPAELEELRRLVATA